MARTGRAAAWQGDSFVAEYPDLKQVTGRSKHGIFFVHDVEEEA